ncbi:NucA/NucB deoxyribonuclease domain-containing protein [Streptomyces lasiicapitis]|uniref:NucA/NucB deoxyribonuclease domain-containing protein n=1 Tax=Streptomyces lasiicapitis TaxID=1923961 RepID=UPI0036B8EB46
MRNVAARRHRLRISAVLLPVLLASVIVPLGSAQGSEDPEQEVVTTEGPVGSKLPDLTALRKPGALDRLRARAIGDEASAGLLPRETVGPAREALPRAGADSMTALEDAASAGRRSGMSAAVSLPEPAHTMTPQQCTSGLAGKDFYIRSRFAVCSGKKFKQVWLRSGRPVGASSFTVLAIGTIPKHSRTMTVMYRFQGFTATGVNSASAMGISTKAKIAKSWPTRVRYKHGGVGTAMPVNRKWAQLLNGGNFKHTVYAAAGQGHTGTDDSIYAVYQPSLKMSAPPGWVLDTPGDRNLFMLPPRWDKAAYLPNRAKGAANFSVSTALVYSTKDGAPEKDVAKHIKLAYTHPGRTQPPFHGKRLAGNKADEPLTRLYKDATRRKENRNTSIYNCKKYFGEGYTEGGRKECDEFPFATTYQGAAEWRYNQQADRYNFSVKALPKKANGAAGNLLRDYYDKNRLIDGPDDGFLMKITS